MNLMGLMFKRRKPKSKCFKNITKFLVQIRFRRTDYEAYTTRPCVEASRTQVASYTTVVPKLQGINIISSGLSLSEHGSSMRYTTAGMKTVERDLRRIEQISLRDLRPLGMHGKP